MWISTNTARDFQLGNGWKKKIHPSNLSSVWKMKLRYFTHFSNDPSFHISHFVFPSFRPNRKEDGPRYAFAQTSDPIDYVSIMLQWWQWLNTGDASRQCPSQAHPTHISFRNPPPLALSLTHTPNSTSMCPSIYFFLKKKALLKVHCRTLLRSILMIISDIQQEILLNGS